MAVDNASMHLSICGHAKHGKSTLAGSMAYSMKAVTDEQLRAFEHMANERGKDFNKYSMIFLQRRTETYKQGTGQPDDSSRTEFPAHGTAHIDGIRLTLIDTPGYSRFINNIVYGIYLSDAAIVVVEGAAGVATGTKAVCRILKAFEIPIACFCVTKMDKIGYSKDRFEEVFDDIHELLIATYSLDESIPIVPVSALFGEGISDPAGTSTTSMSWYGGPCLLEVLQSRKASLESSESSSTVRFAIEGAREIYSPPGVGTVLVGTLEYGQLVIGDKLIAEPISTMTGQRITSTVRSMQLARSVTDRETASLNSVEARAIVALSMPAWTRQLAISYFRKGGVLGSEQARPRTASYIVADVIFFEADTVYSGKEYLVHPHVTGTVARFKKIIDKDALSYDLVEDEYSTAFGELLRSEIEFQTPCCIETHSNFPRLSKFVVREHNRIVACGRCVEIIA